MCLPWVILCSCFIFNSFMPRNCCIHINIVASLARERATFVTMKICSYRVWKSLIVCLIKLDKLLHSFQGKGHPYWLMLILLFPRTSFLQTFYWPFNHSLIAMISVPLAFKTHYTLIIHKRIPEMCISSTKCASFCYDSVGTQATEVDPDKA